MLTQRIRSTVAQRSSSGMLRTACSSPSPGAVLMSGTGLRCVTLARLAAGSGIGARVCAGSDVRRACDVPQSAESAAGEPAPLALGGELHLLGRKLLGGPDDAGGRLRAAEEVGFDLGDPPAPELD